MKINKKFNHINFYTLSAEWKNSCITDNHLSEAIEPDIYFSIDMDESSVKDLVTYLQFGFEGTYGINDILENTYVAEFLLLFGATILSKKQLSEQNVEIQSNHRIDLYLERSIRTLENNFNDTFTVLNLKYRSQMNAILKNKELFKRVINIRKTPTYCNQTDVAILTPEGGLFMVEYSLLESEFIIFGSKEAEDEHIDGYMFTSVWGD